MRARRNSKIDRYIKRLPRNTSVLFLLAYLYLLISPALFIPKVFSRSGNSFEGNVAITTLAEKNFTLSANRASSINLQSSLPLIEKKLSGNFVSINPESDKLETYLQHNLHLKHPFTSYKYFLSEYTADS